MHGLKIIQIYNKHAINKHLGLNIKNCIWCIKSINV